MERSSRAPSSPSTRSPPPMPPAPRPRPISISQRPPSGMPPMPTSASMPVLPMRAPPPVPPPAAMVAAQRAMQVPTQGAMPMQMPMHAPAPLPIHMSPSNARASTNSMNVNPMPTPVPHRNTITHVQAQGPMQVNPQLVSNGNGGGNDLSMSAYAPSSAPMQPQMQMQVQQPMQMQLAQTMPVGMTISSMQVVAPPVCSIQVIDLDDASTRTISWDPNVRDQDFEAYMEAQLRQAFGVSEEAWVDLMDMASNQIIQINKQALGELKGPLCLCLSPKTDSFVPMKRNEIFEIVFHGRALGMTIREHNESVVVNGLKRRPDGGPGAAEESGLVQIGDIIYKVHGARTVGRTYENVVQMLQTNVRPLAIQFFRPFQRDGLYAVEFRGPSLNLTITTDDNNNVVVKDLPMPHPNVPGYAEAHGVHPGDILHAVDGQVLHGNEYNRAVSLLSRPTRPMVIVFARSKVTAPTPVSSRSGAGALQYVSRSSFGGSSAPSPRWGAMSDRPHRQSNCSSMAMTEQGDNMMVEDMLEFCESLSGEGILTPEETDIVKEMVLSSRPDVCTAIRHRNQNAIIAIVRSPKMRMWDHLLKTRESILLAGPVSVKRKKRYHMLLTDHERLLFVNKDTDLLEDEIMCSQIVTVSSRSRNAELNISTSNANYFINDSFIGPVVWVRAILPFTCTQGYLKISSSRRFLGPKKHYFVLRGTHLTWFKRETYVHQVDAKSNSLTLDDATVEETDRKGLCFSIVTPELARTNKKIILTAPSTREYNKWMGALSKFRPNPASSA